MRISFDLDDTLICAEADVPCEPLKVPWFFRPWFREPLRLGASALLQELTSRGHELWIYTTSNRSPRYVKWFLRFHGVRIANVVNQAIHDRMVPAPRPSKAPHLFGISLHIDDSEGVRLEGIQHQFQVIVIDPHDADWASKILQQLPILRPMGETRKLTK